MSDDLYTYQKRGAQFLQMRKTACLADEQGLGKTVEAIVAINWCRHGAEIPGDWRILVCCPSVVLWNWQAEWERWSNYHDRYQVIETLGDTLDLNAQLVICSHRAIIEPHIRSQIVKRTWNVVVLDESHFFRKAETKRAMSFFGIFTDSRFEGVVDRAHRTWLLTGTPMPGDVRDLWPMCWKLWPTTFHAPCNRDRAMTFQEFIDRYAVVERGRFKTNVVGVKNVAELRLRLKRHVLRRRADEVLDLPPLRFDLVTLNAASISTIFNALDEYVEPHIKAALAETDGDPVAAFEILRSLQEFATWRRSLGLAKVQPVLELLDLEINHGALRKIVVFAQHTDVLKKLAEGLAILDIGSMLILGETTPKQRDARIAKFQVDPTCQVALCNIVAGGVGSTLTEASETLMVEMSWLPGENAQAVKRTHRIGQDRPCRVRFVVLAGTGDELIVDVVRRKTMMIRKVFAPS